MKLEYINPFIMNTPQVFSTMLGIETSRGKISAGGGGYIHTARSAVSLVFPVWPSERSCSA